MSAAFITSLFVHFELLFVQYIANRRLLLTSFCRKDFRRKSLARWPFFGDIFSVNLPDLAALKTGDASAWDEAFAWLWPTVFAVAKLKLEPYLPNEVQDVAIESIEQLVEKVPEVKSVEAV